MTQDLPEALRSIQRFEVVDCIDDKHVPAVIPNPHGPWVRYEDHIAALASAPAPVLHLVNDAFAEVAMAYPKAFALHKVGIADTAVREALAAPAGATDQLAAVAGPSWEALHHAWMKIGADVAGLDWGAFSNAVHYAPTTQPSPAWATEEVENIRSILARCRDFIDTTKAPPYPAGADLADEIDVLLAAQPAPTYKDSTPELHIGAGREEDAVAMLVDSGQSNAGEIRELKDLVANLKMEARCHAMEAKTANAKIAEIFQVLRARPANRATGTLARPVIASRNV